MHKLIKPSVLWLAKIYGFFATLPFRSRNCEVSKPLSVSHEHWVKFLSDQFNYEGCRVLEIGSRSDTIVKDRIGGDLRRFFPKATYIGFDFYPGRNVDVVGDAHRLSGYFPEDERFDLIFSSAVFEHLHMPWVVALEIQKLLKVGGYVFIETHFSFSSHERPWHFFQFSDKGLRALFNDALGFDLVESGMSNPMAGFFSNRAAAYLKYLPITELYCHSEILCRKRNELGVFNWSDVNIDDIVERTRYPTTKLP